MRRFSERALVIVASLIFLSIAYVVRHTLIPAIPVVTEHKPAEPLIAPAPLKPQSEG